MSEEFEPVNNNEASSVDDDDLTCPLCMELLDETDRNLFPCSCGYQVCLWCLHYIRNTMGNKCPACRQDYEESNFKYNMIQKDTGVSNKDPKDKDNLMKLNKKKPPANATHDSIGTGPASGNSTTLLGNKSRDISRDKPHLKDDDGFKDGMSKDKDSIDYLKDVRVIQRNLVYVIGIPLKLAKKEILKRNEYFGQYGKIQHIVVNKSSTYNSHWGGPSYTAYITYSKKSEATNAIQGINGQKIDNKYLRASYGTTKYCSYFLKGLKCFNNDCFYLHQYGSESDLYIKDLNLPGTMAHTVATASAAAPKETPTEPKEQPEFVNTETLWNNIMNNMKLNSLSLSNKEKPDEDKENIFNLPIKYCINKYNKLNSIIKLNTLNNSNKMNVVKNIYKWSVNTSNTSTRELYNTYNKDLNNQNKDISKGDKSEEPDKETVGNTQNGESVEETLFTNSNELHVNDIINKINKHNLLITNLIKYNTSSHSSNIVNNIENYSISVLYDNSNGGDNLQDKEDDEELNKLEMNIFKLLQLQLKRNENYMNHLKLISTDF